jgi:structural maintenance of chromosome 3 (chondroitin sulfate proteoglycan 6)
LTCSLTSLTANKRKQIDQVVRYLEERLRELDEEKEELKKYQQLDKQRRSLEYTILDHELNDARNELASVRLALFVMYVYFGYYCVLLGKF